MISGFIKSVEGHLISGINIVIGKVRHSQDERSMCTFADYCQQKGCIAGLEECCSHVASFRRWAARLALSSTFSGSPRNLWWPRFCVGTQSALKRCYSLAGSPEINCLLQTRSFSLFLSVKSSLLIAEIHRLPHSEVNSSMNSPWFVTTRGTRKNLVLSLPGRLFPVLFPR